MKNLILILTLLCMIGAARAESEDLSAIQAANGHGDSIEEVLSDMPSQEACMNAIDAAGIDSEKNADLYENAHDQCANQEYEK